jgi:UDP-N-acetylmuramate dehydrogenase
MRGRTFSPDGARVLLEAAAGEPWDELVADSVSLGLQGLECLSGIPGLVGATPIQNVGAYGQEVADTIDSVRVLDRTSGQTLTLGKTDCGFAYRDSRFKSGEPERFIVLSVRFGLRPGAPPALRYAELTRYLEEIGEREPTLLGAREAVLTLRRKKSMVLDASDPNGRSCGSFFTNPIVELEHAARIEALAGPGMPRYPQPDGRAKLAAGWLIERAGFEKGLLRGPVGLSTRHALAIVCHEGASAAEVLGLAREIVHGVHARFGVALAMEPSLWASGPKDVADAG